jgi:hypothetical protein
VNSTSGTNQPEDDLDHDQRDDGRFQSDEAPVARGSEQQLESLLDASELRFEGAVPVHQIELAPKLAVDPVHRGIVPGGVRLVEQVQHR